MKLNLKTKLYTMDREVLTQDKHEFDKAGKVISTTKEDLLLKVLRFELSLRLATASEDDIELESEDISLIKKLVGKMYAPLVVGQMARLLEGKCTGLEPVEEK